MTDKPIAFQVRTDDGTVLNVRVRSLVWATLRDAAVGAVAVIDGVRYTKIGEDQA